ncbi:hypothetical protein NQZ68_019403 [Dissostichus eleginoides]|nr:hypothetical protein NQZ68_019403 [Dissostichus eleginoides]
MQELHRTWLEQGKAQRQENRCRNSTTEHENQRSQVFLNKQQNLCLFEAMASECSGTMEVAALGRPFGLGMLYDCRNDSLVPELEEAGLD